MFQQTELQISWPKPSALTLVGILNFVLGLYSDHLPTKRLSQGKAWNQNHMTKDLFSHWIKGALQSNEWMVEVLRSAIFVGIIYLFELYISWPKVQHLCLLLWYDGGKAVTEEGTAMKVQR